jgi:CubicO group peptidase (beta-lactamase class C family)
VLIAMTTFAAACDQEPTPSPSASAESIPQLLEVTREKHKLPGLAVAVIADGKNVATEVTGVRKQGAADKAFIDDKFHIGSITKSMTATLAAMLVEEEKIAWTTTIASLFSEFKDQIHPDYLAVTLEQLLSQRGGAPGTAPGDLWRKAWQATGAPETQRLEFVKGILARAPEAKPGTKHIYSNQGYAIAGVMLERAGGKTWEELMRTRLFEPLGMNTAGFGAPASPGRVDQPWGHTKGLFGGINQVPPGPRADNPLAISPAGAVHCSIADLAKYAVFHLAGERGEGNFLKTESFRKLHASAGDDYALGWVVLERAWARGKALMHNGSNTMFYTVIWIAPERNFAVAVATNIGSDATYLALDEVASAMINRYLPR